MRLTTGRRRHLGVWCAIAVLALAPNASGAPVGPVAAGDSELVPPNVGLLVWTLLLVLLVLIVLAAVALLVRRALRGRRPEG